MDSINRQQPEENHKDLMGSEAGKRSGNLLRLRKKAVFSVQILLREDSFLQGRSVGSKIDDDGVLWFLSAKDSHKNKHIAADPAVQLLLGLSSFRFSYTIWKSHY